MVRAGRYRLPDGPAPPDEIALGTAVFGSLDGAARSGQRLEPELKDRLQVRRPMLVVLQHLRCPLVYLAGLLEHDGQFLVHIAARPGGAE